MFSLERFKDKVSKSITEHKPSQNHQEMMDMLVMVRAIEPRVIVEIGCDRGLALKVYQDAFPEAHVIGIESNGLIMDKPITVIGGDSSTRGTRERLVSMLGSRDIDFLFIDGDHTYEAVSKDYALYANLVRDGGIIGFHDVELDAEVEPKWKGLVETRRFFYEVSEDYPKSTIFHYETGTGTGVVWV